MKILAEPIDTIVRFKGKDKPKPYKFRYSDQDAVNHEIKIDKILKVEEIKIAGIKAYVYLCQSEIDGICKLYELKYFISECRWELYKI
ncbi:MAG: hypothetical protein ACOX4P_04895 [Anaerovoracaceae bacterium]|jgi:hypothetical protein